MRENKKEERWRGICYRQRWDENKRNYLQGCEVKVEEGREGTKWGIGA